jgi:RNA polymerase sigma factor (sigma-70 family)
MMNQSQHPHEIFFKAFLDRKIAIQIARKQTRHTPHSWEDAYQAACAKLWEATRQGKFRQGNLEDYCHWAAKVCCRTILDYLKHSHQRQYRSLDQPLPGTDIPLVDTLEAQFNSMDVVERTELHQQIQKSLADLDRKHATTLYSTIGHALLLDIPQKEIGQTLTLDPSQVSRHVKRIREHLGQTFYHPDSNPPIQTDRRRSDQSW